MRPLRCSYLNGRTLHFQLRQDSRGKIRIDPNYLIGVCELQHLLDLSCSAGHHKSSASLLQDTRTDDQHAQSCAIEKVHVREIQYQLPGPSLNSILNRVLNLDQRITHCEMTREAHHGYV